MIYSLLNKPFNYNIGMLFLVSFYITLACDNTDVQPKPKSYLALTYDKPAYIEANIDCPFTFEMNIHSRLEKPKIERYCWANLYYPKQKARVFITYIPVEKNLTELLRDAQQLPLQHTIKADHIEASIFSNDIKKTFGTFYEVEGDAASQAQFYLTDSTQHFLTGSVYFSARPNYDSLIPAAEYLKKDIRHLMESVTWK